MLGRRLFWIAVSLFWSLTLGLSPSFAQTPQPKYCEYFDAAGHRFQVGEPEKIPQQFRASAKCYIFGSGKELASPDSISLKGALRDISIVSPVGRINLRWPRTAETLFGRTPERAMVDAAQTVSRALRQGAFPPNIQSLSLDWSVVFMDADLPGTQIPPWLIHNCHPGWMTPPANVYIVSQRVTSGCGGGRASASKVGDAQLAEVLIHEMGHAIEFQILGASAPMEIMRAEGFASWFEEYASNYSSVISRGSVLSSQASLAEEALNSGFTSSNFGRSAYDYALASMYFRMLVDRRGITGLLETYQLMTSKNLKFLDALKQKLSLSDAQMAKELEKTIQRAG